MMTKTYILGSILVESGLITQSQLDDALHQQQSDGWQLLGKLLVQSGAISRRDLSNALDRQARLIDSQFFGSPHASTRSLFKRSLDIVGAIAGLFLLLLLLPIVAIAIFIDSPGPIFATQPRVGYRGRQFHLWRFRTTTPNAEPQRLQLAHDRPSKLFDRREDPHITQVGKLLRRLRLDRLPQCINVLTGDMSLVGVYPPTLDEITHYTEIDWSRLAVKPGLTSAWQISRRRDRFNFSRMLETDRFYISRWRRALDLKILIATLLPIVRSSASDRAPTENTVRVLNVAIDNLSMQELLTRLTDGFVLTPNVDHLMKLQRDADFYHVYTQADYKVCDSQILMYAARFLGTPLKEKISGSDLFPIFCDHHRANPDVRIFLMGGAAGVADRARDRINARIGRDIVIASHSPSFGFEKNEQECQELINLINQSGATVLAVGVGAPKQEKWICKYRHQLPHVRVFLAVGATIDFEAGTIKRAPKWMSKFGLEWLFRIAADPKRLWKRYLMDDLPFFWLLLKQRFGAYTPRFGPNDRASTSNPALKNS